MRKVIHIAAVLITVSFCFALISCSGEQTEETLPAYGMEVDLNDLDGFVMDYYVSNSDYAEISHIENCVLGYIADTEFADLAAQRIKDVEKQLNCKINVTYVNGGTVKDNIANWVMGGAPAIDAMQDHSRNSTITMRDGFLLGLSELMDVKNTTKWGTIGMNMAMFWQDDQYGVIPATWPQLFNTSISYPFCVNENIVAKVNVTDPRELVENNTWTWDVFEDYLHQMTYHTGSYQVYGFATHPVYFAQMMFRSNGDMLLDYTVETADISTCGYYTNTAFEALDRCTKILYDTCKDNIYPSTSRYDAADAFIANEVGIVCTNTEFMIGTENAFVYNCENFGIVPCPLGPNAEPGDYRSMYEGMSYTISLPILCDGVEETVTVLNALYEPFAEYPTDESIIEYMSNYLFFDDRDARIFWKLAENTEFAFFKEGARELVENITGYSGAPVSLAQALESFEPKYKVFFNDYLIHYFDGIKAVWGDELK